jgi:hypothetical protein
MIGQEAPPAGPAERRFGGLICLRRYWRSKITSNWDNADLQKKKGLALLFNYASPNPPPLPLPAASRLFEMADSGKMLEAPVAHARVAPVSTPVQSKQKKVHYPFWFGGSASCFAAAVTHPLDLGMFVSKTDTRGL